MTLRILLLHGYSSENRGDGLLVEQSLEIVHEALGPDVAIDIVASYPDSFAHLHLKTIGSKPNIRGYNRDYLRLLIKGFDEYDLVVGVGGGYLRFGTPIEWAKTSIVMLPQLISASRSTTRTVYLPQSVGPLRLGTRPLLRLLLSKLDVVWVRDDKSRSELDLANVRRGSDLALLTMNRRSLAWIEGRRPVLSVRRHRGGVPSGALALSRALGDFDGYVQSSVSGNDDHRAVAQTAPRWVVDVKELMDEPSSARVIVAMRLHAALMAIRAGHYVIHLAYERKGFGAFRDLGLPGFVHNVHDFDPREVVAQVNDFQQDVNVRQAYDRSISDSFCALRGNRNAVVDTLRGEFEMDSFLPTRGGSHND